MCVCEIFAYIFTYFYILICIRITCEIFRMQDFNVSNSRTRVHISSILPWRRDAKYSSSKQCTLRGRKGEGEGEDRVEESETKRGRIGEGETLDPLLGWLPHTADLAAAPANPHTPRTLINAQESVLVTWSSVRSRPFPPLHPLLFLSLSSPDLSLSITFYISPTNPSIRHFRFVFRFFEHSYSCSKSRRCFVAWHDSHPYQL